MAKYDLENLAFFEKINLLYAEKLIENDNAIEKIINTNLITEVNSYKFKLKDSNNDSIQFNINGILYEINIHQSKTQDKFTINIRFEGIDLCMIRFDFGNNLRHTNNVNKDNEYVVVGSHIHFFSNTDKYATKNVLPMSRVNKFKNLNDLSNAVIKLMNYMNIRINIK